MKKLKLALILMATILLFSCEKDEQGRILKYYKHVTGEGYVFYKYLDGTISPCAMEVTIEAEYNPNSGMMGWNIGNAQRVKTNSKGHYSFRFVKSVDNWEMKRYHCIANVQNVWFNVPRKGFNVDIVQQVAEKASKKNPQVIFIDTLWVTQFY
jgi:hypothetical protein